MSEHVRELTTHVHHSLTEHSRVKMKWACRTVWINPSNHSKSQIDWAPEVCCWYFVLLGAKEYASWRSRRNLMLKNAPTPAIGVVLTADSEFHKSSHCVYSVPLFACSMTVSHFCRPVLNMNSHWVIFESLFFQTSNIGGPAPEKDSQC